MLTFNLSGGLNVTTFYFSGRFFHHFHIAHIDEEFRLDHGHFGKLHLELAASMAVTLGRRRRHGLHATRRERFGWSTFGNLGRNFVSEG